MTVITTPRSNRPPVPEAAKDESMLKQKAMMAGHYDRLTSMSHGETGEKVRVRPSCRATSTS